MNAGLPRFATGDCLECQRRTGAVISNQARFRREQVTFAHWYRTASPSLIACPEVRNEHPLIIFSTRCVSAVTRMVKTFPGP
jgi:hypothetical protein